MTDRSLRIGPVRSSVSGAHLRVEARVGDEPVWFESRAVPLEPAPEAFGSAMLLAAASAPVPLEMADAVSPRWLEGIQGILEVWDEWWGCSRDVVDALSGVAAGDDRAGTRAPDVAVCFTGGVDSFHTLLHHDPPPAVLAYCHGYDIYLHDAVRAEAWSRSFSTIADELDVRPAWISTNLRTNGQFAGLDWERSHGGALAALGHLLAGSAGVLLVSSGLADAQAVPWGSHRRIDSRWSSERVEIRRFGGDRTRLQKVGDLVDHELPQQHLRVCWEHRRPTGNCSRCDKCLNTMLLLDAWGAASRFAVFDWDARLDRLLDEVPATFYVRTYRDLLDAAPPRRVARAVRRLLRRTERLHPERTVVGSVTPRG